MTPPNEGIKECLEKAKESGYYAEKKDEEVNLVDTIVTLYKLLSSKEDLFMLLWVIFLLSVSFYLDLESKLLTGQVMGMIPTVFMNKDNIRKFFSLVNLYVLTAVFFETGAILTPTKS